MTLSSMALNLKRELPISHHFGERSTHLRQLVCALEPPPCEAVIPAKAGIHLRA